MAGDGAAQFSAQVTRVRNVGKFFWNSGQITVYKPV